MNIIQVYKQFPSHGDCIAYLEKIRWKYQPVCPYCKSIRVTSFKKEQRHHCNNCNTSFSVTVGTIFHKTKLDLQKWFLNLAEIKEGYTNEDWDSLCRDENGNNNIWELMFQLRLELTNLYRLTMPETKK